MFSQDNFLLTILASQTVSEHPLRCSEYWSPLLEFWSLKFSGIGIIVLPVSLNINLQQESHFFLQFPELQKTFSPIQRLIFSTKIVFIQASKRSKMSNWSKKRSFVSRNSEKPMAIQRIAKSCWSFGLWH